jgi:hypothetical protein
VYQVSGCPQANAPFFRHHIVLKAMQNRYVTLSKLHKLNHFNAKKSHSGPQLAI